MTPAPPAGGGGDAPPRDVEALGRRFRVDGASEARFWDRFEGRAWEPETLAALDPLTGPGALFLDVGAWIGPTALFAAAGGAEVVALEPDPVAAALFRANLALNPDLAPRVRLVEAVLSPREGTARLAADRGRGGKSTSSVLHRNPSVVWERPAVTPAGLAGTLGEGRRVVLKIDVEGGEYPLAGSLRPLTARADAVLLSLHPRVALAGLGGLARLRARLALLRAGHRLRRDFAGLRARPLAGGPGRWDGALAPAGGEWLFERPGLVSAAAGR